MIVEIYIQIMMNKLQLNTHIGGIGSSSFIERIVFVWHSFVGTTVNSPVSVTRPFGKSKNRFEAFSWKIVQTNE